MNYFGRVLFLIIIASIFIYSTEKTLINRLSIKSGKETDQILLIRDGDIYTQPHTFAVDSDTNFYIPDEYLKAIKIYKNQVLIDQIKVSGHIRYMVIDSTSKSLYVFKVPENNIYRYSLKNKIWQKIICGLTGYLGYFADNSEISVLLFNKNNYSIQQFDTLGNYINKFLLNINYINQSIGFSPVFVKSKRNYYFASDRKLMVYNYIDNSLYEIKDINLGDDDCIFGYYNDLLFSFPSESGAALRILDIFQKRSYVADYTILLNKQINGEYGIDYFYCPDGLVFDIKNLRNTIFLMGSDQNNTYIWELKYSE